MVTRPSVNVMLTIAFCSSGDLLVKRKSLHEVLSERLHTLHRNKMTRGNQREKDRERAAARSAKLAKGKGTQSHLQGLHLHNRT